MTLWTPLHSLLLLVCSGGTFAQFREMTNILRLQIMSTSSCNAFQNKYVFGATNNILKFYRCRIISEYIKKMTFDSPGCNGTL